MFLADVAEPRESLSAPLARFLVQLGRDLAFQPVEQRPEHPGVERPDVRIPVDGEPVRFDHLSERDGLGRDGPHGRYDHHAARKGPGRAVELVGVNDVEPYVEGSRRLRELGQKES